MQIDPHTTDPADDRAAAMAEAGTLVGRLYRPPVVGIVALFAITVFVPQRRRG